MSRFFFSTLIVLLIAGMSGATVRVVDNNPNAVGVFTDGQTAINASVAGDTVYFAGSVTGYGSISINRPLTIIGAGNFLTEYPESQARPLPSYIVSLYLAEGAAGTVVYSMKFNSVILWSSNVSLRRCVIDNGGNTLISTDRLISDILVEQCYLSGSYNGYPAIFLPNTQNTNFYNNYMVSTSTTQPLFWTGTSASNIDLVNNVISGNVELNNGYMANNIMISGTLTANNCRTFNNIGSGVQFSASNNNQQNIDMSSVFIGTGTTDGRWQLSESSPARAAGIGGVDCGIFGNTNPYILACLPPIPTITSFTSQAATTAPAGLPITIRARGHY